MVRDRKGWRQDKADRSKKCRVPRYNTMSQLWGIADNPSGIGKPCLYRSIVILEPNLRVYHVREIGLLKQHSKGHDDLAQAMSSTCAQYPWAATSWSRRFGSPGLASSLHPTSLPLRNQTYADSGPCWSGERQSIVRICCKQGTEGNGGQGIARQAQLTECPAAKLTGHFGERLCVLDCLTQAGF